MADIKKYQEISEKPLTNDLPYSILNKLSGEGNTIESLRKSLKKVLDKRKRVCYNKKRSAEMRCAPCKLNNVTKLKAPNGSVFLQRTHNRRSCG